MDSIDLLRKVTVGLRRLPGTHPLADAVRRHHYGAGVREVVDFDRDQRMALDLGEHMASQIFWFGSYSRDVLRVVAERLRPGHVFFDVGANIGEVTLAAAKRVGPAGAVYSFEPMEEIHRKLAAHVAANGHANVRRMSCGVSDRAGRSAIYAGSARYPDGSQHDGLGTLFAAEGRGRLVSEVELTTVDEVVRREGLGRLDGIKLDIEGAELAAIRGAADSLERFRPWLVVEVGRDTCRAAGYEPADVLAALPGYRFFRLARGRDVPVAAADLGPWQNVLCVPSTAG